MLKENGFILTCDHVRCIAIISTLLLGKEILLQLVFFCFGKEVSAHLVNKN